MPEEVAFTAQNLCAATEGRLPTWNQKPGSSETQKAERNGLEVVSVPHVYPLVRTFLFSPFQALNSSICGFKKHYIIE